MRLFHIVFSAGLAALSAACSAAIMAIDRFVGALLSIVPAQGPRLAFDGPAPAMNIGGHSIDPALRQSMRHESMTARVGAPRGV